MTNILLYSAAVMIWGSTWFAIEFQLGVVSPQVSLVYRFGLASVILFAWCLIRNRPLRFNPADHLYFMGLGLFLFGLNYIFSYSAQIYIISALNAIVCSCMVWMNILNARVFIKTRIDARTWTGAAFGITGITIVFWPSIQNVRLTDGIVIGIGASFMGALLASLGNILSQLAQRRGLPVMQSNAWGMCYGCLLNIGAAVVLGKPFLFDSSTSYLISLLYLAVFGSVVAFGCYLTLLGRIGAHRAGYAMVMFPLVALVLSALFENMALDVYTYTGVILALIGNLIILNRNKERVPAPTALHMAREGES